MAAGHRRGYRPVLRTRKDMTTIQLDDKTADGLNAQANALGMTLQDFLRSIAGNGSHSSKAPADMPYNQWSARLHAWAAGFPALPHLADDSRESVYAGRDE